jgi:anti-sigma regulatory factor (Ser/Thr protein kinase)
MRDILNIPVSDSSSVGESRRLAASVCRLLNFSETDTGRISIIVTEMAGNLVKHASGGELLIRSLECDGEAGIEILSVDHGPGMANPLRSLQDGVSTAGSLGTGLGAIMRMSSLFDIFSAPEKGAVIMSRCWRSGFSGNHDPRPMEVGAVCIPMVYEDPCGDCWAAGQTLRRTLLLVCDGLGHGIAAAEASGRAKTIFKNHSNRLLREIVEEIHSGLKSTRGAALAVLEIDHINPLIRYCSIGNISIRIINGNVEKNLVSQNGIVGHVIENIREFIYPWDSSGLIVAHSDGLSAKWWLANYPGLITRHPSVIAAVLYRDFKRENDDMTVLVAKKAEPKTGRSLMEYQEGYES